MAAPTQKSRNARPKAKRRNGPARSGRPFSDGERAALELGKALAALERLHPGVIRRAIAHALRLMRE